jgi:hypothetical protein
VTYKIEKLAPGAYDVFRGDEVIASLVRNGPQSRIWTAELLDDLPGQDRPSPFTEAAHRFDSLEEACAWLGAEVEGVGVRVPAVAKGYLRRPS